MNEEYVRKAIQDIEALDNIPRQEQKPFGNTILYRLLLMLYDELGIQTDTQRKMIDALYDLIEVLQTNRH